MNKLSLSEKTTLYFCYLIIGIIITLSTIGLAAAIISMLFGRPIGDDYGSITTFHLNGDWIQEALFSLSTTGRYGQSITASSLYGILGNQVVTLLPLFILFWFIGICFLYARSIISIRGRDKDPLLINVCALSISMVFTFLVLFINNAPFTSALPGWISFQLFFWPSGIVTYTIPLLILLTGSYVLFMSQLFHKTSTRTRVIFFGAITLSSSLYNEVQPAFIAVMSIGLLVLSYSPYYSPLNKHRYLLVTSGSASIAGLILAYFSPGRLARSEFLDSIGPATTHGSLIDSVVRNTMTLFREFYARPRELALLILIGLVLSIFTYFMLNKKNRYQIYLLDFLPYALLLPVLFVTSVLISITLVAVGYGYTAGIYTRTMLIAQILYVMTIPTLTFIISGLLLSRNQVSRLLLSVSAICLGIFFIISLQNYSAKILTQVHSSVTYANQWDRQDAILKKAAENNKQEIIYLDNPATGIGDGFSLTCTGPYAKSTMWLNAQIWEYYGKKEVRICEKQHVRQSPQ